MKPIQFPEQTHTLAEDQEEYIPIPVYIGVPPQHETISCWKLSWKERFEILRSGKLWVRQLTFGEKFHPILPEAFTPFIHDINQLIEEELK